MEIEATEEIVRFFSDMEIEGDVTRRI